MVGGADIVRVLDVDPDLGEGLEPRALAVARRRVGLAGQVEDEVLQGLTAAERRQLLGLLRQALRSAPPQALWRAEEGD